MVILGTTILIHLLRGDPKAIAKIRVLEESDKSMYTTQINLFEIIQGIYSFADSPDQEIASLEVLLERVKVLDLTYFGAYHAGRLPGALHKKALRSLRVIF